MERPELKDTRLSPSPVETGKRLVGRVRRVKTGLRLVLVCEQFLILLLMLFAVAALGMVFILYLIPTPIVLWSFSCVTLIGVLWLYYRFIFMRRRREFSDLAVSAWIEESIPGLQDRLITAIEFSQGVTLSTGGALIQLFEPAYVEAFFAQTDSLIRRTFLSRVLFRKRLLILVLLLLASWFVFSNSHYYTIYTWQDLRNIYVGSHLALFRGLGEVIVVEPGNVTLARGEDLPIMAYSVRPGRRLDLEVFYRALEQAWESSPMAIEASGQYSFQFQRLAQPLEYFVSDGQSRSATFRIQVVDRPQLASLRVKLIYPPYTGIGTLIGQEGHGNIEALPGTHVEVVVQFRQPVKGVEMMLGGDAGGSERQTGRYRMVESSGSWKNSFTLASPGWYRISAVSPEGYTTGNELTYRIALLEDAKPDVRFLYPTKPIDFLRTDEFPELQQGRRPRLPIRYEATDDFGIARIELHYAQENGESGHLILAEFGYGEKKISGEYQWNLDRLWGKGVVEYFLRAYDHLGAQEERTQGETEQFSDSARLLLFWGAPVVQEELPDQPGQQRDTQAADGRTPDDEQGEAGQRLADALKKLAERVSQAAEEQEEINEEAGRLSSQRTRVDSGIRAAQQQERVSQELERIRQEMEQKSREWKESSVRPPFPDDMKPIQAPEMEDEDDGVGQDEDTQPGTDGGRLTTRTGHREIRPSSRVEPDRMREDRGFPLAERMEQMAESLKGQRIEQTDEGFQTRSGLTGEMQLNQQRLAQGRFQEARDRGQEIEQQLKRLERELLQMAGELDTRPGMEQAQQEQDRQRGIPGSPGESRQDTPGTGAGFEGSGKGIGEDVLSQFASVPYDDYRPSQWDPPAMRDLGARSSRLGDFTERTPDKDPFGDAPVDERYPVKYQGLVELYFRALADHSE